MAAPNRTFSLAMERTSQWVFSQELPPDLIVQVGEASFPLHKFMLVAKSNYIRKLIRESEETEENELTRIDLSDIPGGTGTFEKAAKFCYGVKFDITAQNVAALRCAAEFLQMTEGNNLAGKTEDYLSHVAFFTLTGAITVLRSCRNLLPLADELNTVKRCVEAVSAKACSEANFPSRSPVNWWTEELAVLDVDFFGKVIVAMKNRGAKPKTLAAALIAYAERSLSTDRIRLSNPSDSDSDHQTNPRKLLESVVDLFPSDKTAFPASFVCCLLRCAIYLRASNYCRSELEKRIAAVLELATVEDLLVLSFAYDGDRLSDLETVRRIVSVFIENEKHAAVISAADDNCSVALRRVTKTVDAYLAEIASFNDLTISKFNGIATLIPKFAREIEDDLYRAVDIYLKAHPKLDEIEREKVCSVMDPLKLSYEARVHASQNKRLPVQMVLHALYYDQLRLRSEEEEEHRVAAAAAAEAAADVSLVKENEELRTELMRMKMYVTDLEKNVLETTSSSSSKLTKKATFLSSVSRRLGKMNPFRNGSKDTTQLDDGPMDLNRPRRRRFSVS